MSQPQGQAPAAQEEQVVPKADKTIEHIQVHPKPQGQKQQNQKQGDKAIQKEGQKNKRQPRKGYRLEERKEIEIKRNHSDAREKAILFKELIFGIMGRRRFRRIELTCSLNLLFNTLKLCSVIHKNVPDMFMIVELDKVKYTDFEDENDRKGTPKEDSIFRITLTKEPTEQDRKSYGFHEAFKAEDIKKPLTLNERRTRNPKKGGRKDKRDDRRDRNRDDRRDRGDRRGKDQKKERRDRREKDERQQRDERRYRDDIRDDRRDNRRDRKDPKEDRDMRYERDERRYDRYRNRSYRDREDDKVPRRQNKDRRDNSYEPPKQSYIPKKQKKGREKPVRQEEGIDYKRGSAKNRGTGKLASHHYDPSHIRQEDRGDRRPPKQNRYELSDEDWQ